MSFIYTFAVNRYLDSKMVNFRVMKIGFHGDTFVARQHNTENESFTIIHNKRGFCTSPIPTNGISTCWMLE